MGFAMYLCMEMNVSGKMLYMELSSASILFDQFMFGIKSSFYCSVLRNW